MSPRTRNGLFAGAAIALAIVIFLLLRRERSWSVSLSSDRDEAPPWISFQLTASLPGAPEDTTGWSFQWSTDEGTLQSTGPKAWWRAGEVGQHEVTLKVTSPRGTEHVATLAVQVKVGEVLSGPMSASAPAAEAAALPESPITISDITVEKSEVCSGEPSTIGVKAKYKGGDSDLITTIDSSGGNQVGFVRYDAPPGLYRVRVVVSDRFRSVPDRIEYTYIRVNNCRQDQAMMLRAEAAPPTPDEYKLTANFAKVGDSFDPVESKAKEYHWDFGDGKTAVTTGMTTTHVFPHEAEREDRYQQTFLVKLESVDASGAVLSRAETTLAFTNMINEFKIRYKTLVLTADYVGVPTRDERTGRYTQDVTLINSDEKETADLAALQLEFRDCQGDVAEVRPVAVNTVFASTSIPPRGRITGQNVLSADDVKGRCFVHATVAGLSQPSGLKVDGRWVIHVGPPSKTITDPAQLAAMDKARQVLGKQFVTPDDLQRLEDDGRITPGLFPVPQAAGGAPPGASAAGQAVSAPKH